MTDLATEMVAFAETCPLGAFSPMHPDLLKCPYAMNQRLHREAPVYKDPLSGIFFVSRYADVVAMASDHETFSSVMPGLGTGSLATTDPDIAAIVSRGYPNVSTMLTQDPPLQRRYRKFVDGAFSPANLKALEPLIERTSNALIDRFIDKNSCEFLSEFGVPLPLTIIASQIGAPFSDRRYDGQRLHRQPVPRSTSGADAGGARHRRVPTLRREMKGGANIGGRHPPGCAHRRRTAERCGCLSICRRFSWPVTKPLRLR
jgi:cytochrome P450